MKIIISESQFRQLIKEYQNEIDEIDITGTWKCNGGSFVVTPKV